MGRICFMCGHVPKTPVFRFPKNTTIRAEWLQFCELNDQNVNESSALCIRHFTKEDVLHQDFQSKAQNHTMRSRVRNRLKTTAIPTLLRQNQDIQSYSLKGPRTNPRNCFLCQANDAYRSYFSFPKDPQRRKTWLRYCGINPPDENSDIELDGTKYLCDKHFSDDDIFKKRSEKGITRLRQNAVPKMPSDTVSQHLPSSKLLVLERECLTIVPKTIHDDVQPAPRLPPKHGTARLNDDVNHNDPLLEPKLEIVEIETVFVKNEDEANLQPDSQPSLPCSTELFNLKFNPQCSECGQFINHLRTHANRNTSPNVNESSTSVTPKRSTRKRRVAYVGDVNTADFDCIDTARRAFDLAKNEVMKCKKKIEIMNKRLKRRDAKLNVYKNIIDQLQNKSDSE